MLRRVGFKKLLVSKEALLLTTRASHQLEVKDGACVYMPIIDMSSEGQRRYQRQIWYDTIKALPTVEQKLYELTLHHRPRNTRFIISPLSTSYNGIFFQRYITRTHLINQLPDKLMQIDVDKELDEIRDAFKESVTSYYLNNCKCQDTRYADVLGRKSNDSQMVNLLISHCYKKLALRNDYILKSTIQHAPRINSYWFHSGFKSKLNKLHEQNLTFQFKDVPEFIIRMQKPLNPILSLDDPLCATAEIPSYNYKPSNFGFVCDRKWITSVPGHWFDDPCDFPFLLVYNSDKIKTLLHKLHIYDLSKIEDSVGITSSFGWLNAVATYQGFTPYHDLTYPLVSQAILTNGQDWNFFVYQLNTIAFHSDVDNKDRRNICWSSGKMRLFDTIEDGQIKGFNDEVFKILLKFLLNAPIDQPGVTLKPYLGVDNRTEEEFASMRYFYRRMYSQAPDPLAYEREIPTWRKIYVNSKVAKPMPYVKME